MTIQLKCPSCRKPIFFPEVEEIDEDQLEIICPDCQYKYSLVSAQVLGFASEVETTPANKYKKQPSYRRIYELRLVTANRKLKALRLETPGPEQKISAFPKDEMLMLYTLRGKALDELFWIENHTTGKSCLLKKPDAKARTAGVTTGIVTLFAGGCWQCWSTFQVNFHWQLSFLHRWVPESMQLNLMNQKSGIRRKLHA